MKVENQSLCFVLCSVAPESANHAFLSKFTLSACDRLLIVIKAYMLLSKFEVGLFEHELVCSVIATQASLRFPLMPLC